MPSLMLITIIKNKCLPCFPLVCRIPDPQIRTSRSNDTKMKRPTTISGAAVGLKMGARSQDEELYLQ